MTVYSRLHPTLRIPEGYYRDSYATPLDEHKRVEAISLLIGADELEKHDDITEALLNRLAQKLTKLHEVTRLIEITPPRAKKREPKDKAPPKIRSRADPEWADKKAKKLARKEKIIAEIIADPAVSSLKLARKHGVDESCVRRYKSQLRFEGKIA